MVEELVEDLGGKEEGFVQAEGRVGERERIAEIGVVVGIAAAVVVAAFDDHPELVESVVHLVDKHPLARSVRRRRIRR